MIITGGEYKGRKILAPEGNITRPTLSKVRMGVFNTLFSIIGDFEDKTFLDVFGGSGIMGLEALSRGFKEVTVFEKNEFTRYIEFVDNTTVQIWDTDGHGPYHGTYTVNGNKVYFKNLHDRYWGRYYISATYTSRSLTVGFSYNAEHTTGPYYDTYTKK